MDSAEQRGRAHFHVGRQAIRCRKFSAAESEQLGIESDQQSLQALAAVDWGALVNDYTRGTRGNMK
jgi:hypothetical protein